MINQNTRTSFYELFNEKSFSVEIPIIQRDYAQGRPSKNEIIDSFLDTLKKYLVEGKPNRDLDFVYGTINNKIFIPLDGQQRLTTLFLLHWYLAQISNNFKKFQDVFSSNGNSKFTYKTRSSSKEFCDCLVKYDLSELIKSKTSNKLQKKMTNQKWFCSSWKNDATVVSMLNVIDLIHDKFQEDVTSYDKLTNNNIITFLLLELNDNSLTDHLYIKMNSRGLQLTQFENFKAQLLDSEILMNEIAINSKIINLKSYISQQIDAIWAEFFWKYRNKFSNDDTIDDEMLNFLRAILLNSYAKNSKSDKTVIDNLLDKNIKNISFRGLTKNNVISVESVKDLVLALDLFSNEKFFAWIKNNERIGENFFLSILNFDIDLKNRVILFAITEFYQSANLQEQLASFEIVEEWLRVIINLVINSDITKVEHYLSAIASIKNIISYKDDIHGYLIDESTKIDFFRETQVYEEKIKAHLILKNSEWKKIIVEAEKHEYFTGQIGFLLHFVDIFNYIINNKEANWSDEQDKEYRTCFISYYDKVKGIFDKDGVNKDLEIDFRRALLSKGNYFLKIKKFPKTNKYKYSMYGNKSTFLYEDTWKCLLRQINNSDYSDNNAKYFFIKMLLDDPSYDCKDIKKSFEKIIKESKDHINDWRIYFIDKPLLFEEYPEYPVILAEKLEGVSDLKPIIYLIKDFKAYTKTEIHSYYLFEKLKNINSGKFEYESLVYGNEPRISSKKPKKLEISYEEGSFKFTDGTRIKLGKYKKAENEVVKLINEKYS